MKTTINLMEEKMKFEHRQKALQEKVNEQGWNWELVAEAKKLNSDITKFMKDNNL